MNRRDTVLALLALGAAPLIADAQQPGKLYRIGWIGNSNFNAPEARAVWDAFRLELQRRGWVEGRNIAFEHRFAEGAIDRFPQLARELVELKVDLILASTSPAAISVKKATDSIPVVFASTFDPVRQGIVASLARPGGNLTGLSTQNAELIGKRMQLLKEAFPRIARVAYMSTEPEAGANPLYNEPVYQAAKALQLEVLPVKVQRAEMLSGAFPEVSRADAWFVADSILYFSNRKVVVELLGRQRKPAIYGYAEFVEAGGLMSYTVDLKDHFRQAAGFVDRILRGAKPADLPVEQPTQFELVINLKTAKALGITIPQSMRFRADRVIE
jgi:putative ABC transport system substrate-binding protein